MQSDTRIGWRGEVLPLQKHEAFLRKLSYAGVICCMAGVVTAPALLSAGIVIIMVAGLALMPFREQLRRFWAHKPAVLMSLLFLMQLVSGIWTRKMVLHDGESLFGLDVWLEEVKIKAPLFLGMYGLAVLGPFSVQKVRLAWMVLLAGCFFVGTGTVVDYALHTEEINARIMVSKEMQVWLGCNHIYFSIVMAFAILANIWSLSKPGPVIFKGDKYLIGIVGLISFFEMHVLTTRTGLVGLYITIVVLGLVVLLRQRRYWIALLLVVGMASVPVLGYYRIDSFKHRIDNTVMDVTEYFKGNDPNYLSIGTRLESWKTAIHLWQKHPLYGVGMADLKADMTDQYVADNTKLCPENFQQPHNQFIQNLAGWGILGLITICIAWFYPVFARSWPKDMLFWAFWLNYTLAMMGESTLERQVGVCFLVPCFMLSLGVGGQAQSEQTGSIS
jgi:O-antigen ligase